VNNHWALRYAVATACGYELVAIMVANNDKLPTISTLCWRHRILSPLIIAGLAAHLSNVPEGIL
jgi:hypothetical protein